MCIVASAPAPTPTQASSNVDWDWISSPNHNAPVEPFNNLTSGWTRHLSSQETELEMFLLLFSEDCRNICITETNKYADQTGDCTTKRWSKWMDLNHQDLTKFLAIRMLMGINKKPDMTKYWSRDAMFHFPIISKILPQDRFFEIQKYLHFSDNNDYVQGDRVFKTRTLWETCTANFSSLLNPHKKISIDESLILHKGRLYFHQFIPNKRSRFGIKTFSIVDEETGFILNSIIYSEKNQDLQYSTKEYGYGGAIVLELARPYLNNFHHIYCDNFFTSPNLAIYLLQQKTYLCGTLRKGRKNAAIPPSRMRRGDVEVFSSNSVMNEFWRDKKIVRMISTTHSHEMVDVRKRDGTIVKKPKSLVDYNNSARGIDQSDMQMHFNSVKRKTRKWYKKLFFQLIDMCFFNAFKMYKSLHPHAKFLDFQLNFIRQVVALYGLKETTIPAPSRDLERLVARHFPAHNPPTKGKPHGSRICHVCSQNKSKNNGKCKETRYQCDICKVALCIVPCFRIYHTLKNF